jgi:hypothetical protein
MARVVRSLQYPAGDFKLPPIPVADEFLRRYPEARIKSFPTFPEGEAKTERIEIAQCTPAPTRFKHLLRYDAESVFWDLLWCCIQAQRAEPLQEDNISPILWSVLTYHGPDSRDTNFILRFPKGCLHPAYRELESLLESMSMHLYGDLSYAEDERRKADEYLHEAFQRLILNFLSANSTKDFMRTRKHKNSRGVLGNPMDKPSRSTTVTGKRKEYPAMAVSSVCPYDSWSKLSLISPHSRICACASSKQSKASLAYQS